MLRGIAILLGFIKKDKDFEAQFSSVKGKDEKEGEKDKK